MRKLILSLMFLVVASSAFACPEGFQCVQKIPCTDGTIVYPAGTCQPNKCCHS